jgi:hypothetical protein
MLVHLHIPDDRNISEFPRRQPQIVLSAVNERKNLEQFGVAARFRY